MSDKEKKEYSRPAARKVELSSDEVLGSGCKATDTTAAPVQGGSGGCIANNCSSIEGS